MSGYFELIKIRENIYHIGSPESVFLDLVIGEKKALVFDTGYGFCNIKEEIRKVTQLPLIVVNSHGHLDHSNGNYLFDSSVYIHKKDLELCMQHNTPAIRKKSIELAKHSVDLVTHDVKNILPEDFDEKKYISRGAGKLVTVEEGKIFDLGGIELEVIELPGHTKGSIGLLCEKEKILLTGDAMNPFLWLFAEECENLDVYKSTLKKAKKMKFDIFLMGHNSAPALKEDLDSFLDCAENIDFEKGLPFRNPLAKPGVEARICTRRGYDPMDFDKPGFASIVISKGHL